MNPWALADVRFGAHCGLAPDLARGPKSAMSRPAERHFACGASHFRINHKQALYGEEQEMLI